MNRKLVLGADIGGSHITVGMVNLQDNALITSTKLRVELNSKGDLESILNAWQTAIENSYLLYKQKPTFLGISMPGPLDYEKGISLINGQDKYDAIFGLNIKELLCKRIGIPEKNIRFINDAVAFLKGEILGGAAINGKNVIGLTLGTGLGSAKAINNEDVVDADLWKMPFKKSIAEEYLSTRWFVARYHDQTGLKLRNVRELFNLAVDNDITAIDLFKEFGANLGLFLQQFIKMEGDIDTVVLGGNIAKAAHLFTQDVRNVLGNNYKSLSLNPAILGEDAALIGAAGVWKEELSFNIPVV